MDVKFLFKPIKLDMIFKLSNFGIDNVFIYWAAGIQSYSEKIYQRDFRWFQTAAATTRGYGSLEGTDGGPRIHSPAGVLEANGT